MGHLEDDSWASITTENNYQRNIYPGKDLREKTVQIVNDGTVNPLTWLVEGGMDGENFETIQAATNVLQTAQDTVNINDYWAFIRVSVRSQNADSPTTFSVVYGGTSPG